MPSDLAMSVRQESQLQPLEKLDRTAPMVSLAPGPERWVAPTAIRVNDLRKRYRRSEAIRGVSLSLGRGERLALLGPNGAGKTTLVRCLAGRARPDSGTIEMHGKRLPPSGGRETLGFVPQDIAIYSDLTTRENLSAFARFHGLRGNLLRQRVDWALSWIGLEDRQHDLVGGFSGGMKRRVNIACGVMHRPGVLLLDEPTVGVDPQSRQRIFEMLDELHASGTSILLTTHHLDEAQSRCDRIVIIDHGSVVADGTITQLIAATIGPARQVRVQVDRRREVDGYVPELRRWRWAPASAAAGVSPGRGRLERGDNARSDVLKASVDDVASDLPSLLEEVREAGFDILNVEVHSPSLHDVFMHLTGGELRD